MTLRSLSAQTIMVRLGMMRDLLHGLDELGAPTRSDLEQHRLSLWAAERILTQLVDLAVDINQHVASTVLQSPGSDYRESFDSAAIAGLISASLAEQLKPSVGMRNVLMHSYVNVDLDQLSAAIPVAREQYGDYVRQVARWLADQ